MASLLRRCFRGGGAALSLLEMHTKPEGAGDVGIFSKSGNRGLRVFRGLGNRTDPSSGRQRVLFVSHEATRTGAPMIILNVLRHFSQRCDIQCETILHNGGHLAGEFRKHSAAVECLNAPRKACDEVRQRVSKFIQRERGNPPVLAICNSMESRFIAEVIAEAKIPVIYLVHELPSSYAEEDYQNVYAYSDKVVFPVHVVREAADQKAPIPAGKAIVLPQGLLNPEFGTRVTRAAARKKVLGELSLPENAFVVLGCGTLDLRKGIDHFANIARLVQARSRLAAPIHFVWVGEGPRWTHSPWHYVQLDLEKSGASSFVHFIGERADVEPYFVASDLFLMSSRVDPFPCVIHEAMAAGLPIITFQNSGGAAEAVAGGAGLAVPYADYAEASSVICTLASQPELAQGMRSRSLERVQTRYRFEDYGEKLVDLAELVSGKQLRVALPRLHDARAA